MKKAYITPEITVHGTVEEITQGSGSWSFKDFGAFGFNDPIGNCGNNSCVRSS